MMKYEKIGVFLSANSQVDDICHQAVREVGEWIGRTRRTLIYGGAKKGHKAKWRAHFWRCS